MYETYLTKFELEPQPENPHCVVRITEDPYKGTLVTLGEWKKSGNSMKFNYEVLDNPTGVDTQDVNFIGFISGILLSLIEKSLTK